MKQLATDANDTRIEIAQPVDESELRVEARERASAVQGVILAGVHSWGDFVLDGVISRPLVPIAARPLVTHVLTWLRGGGLERANICAASPRGTQPLRGGDAAIAASEAWPRRGRAAG